jgi:ribosomal protein S18 acetylase RimI-like enzyme
MRARLVEPTTDQILAYCAEGPVERVFHEDVARRGNGRFAALELSDGRLQALCHLGTNVVPSGRGCGAFAEVAERAAPRMLIGEQEAVTDLWEAARRKLGKPREDRRAQPVYVSTTPPEPGGTGIRLATNDDLDLLVPACAKAHYEELGVDPLRRDANGFRWRTRVQVEERRSWVWIEDGVIFFKAEASAWTPDAVQLQQVWVDPPARRQGNGMRALRDLIRLLLDEVPAVCLFVRAENVPALRLYDAVGMEHVLDYRSVLF